MTGSQELRRSARSGAVGLAGAVCNGALGFLLAVVITRGFGPAGAGALFVLIGLLTVAGVACCLGADTALVWALPRHRHEPARAARLLPAAAAPGLAVAVAVALAGVLAAPGLAPVLLSEAGSAGEAGLRLVAAAVPVAVAMTLALAAVRGVRPVGAYVGLQLVLLPASRPVLIGAVALAGGGLAAAAAGFLAPMLLVLVLAVLLVRPLLGSPGGWPPWPRREQWRTVWGFALPRAGSAAIDSGSVWVGVWLTAALAGQAQAGVFGAVGRYALAGLVALHGLRVAVAPQLSRLLGAGQRDAAAAVHRQTTGWVIVLAWPLYLLLAWFSPGFLAVFGSGFAAGAPALSVLAVAMLVSTGLGNVQTLLLMSGRSGWHLAAVAGGLASTVTLALPLIPRYGVLGAAMAWGSGIVVENLTAAVAARVALGRPLLGRGLAGTAAVIAVAVSGICLLAAAAAGRGPAGLVLALALLAVAALATLAVATARAATRARLAAAVSVLLDRRRSDVDNPEPGPGGHPACDPHPDPARAGALRRADS